MTKPATPLTDDVWIDVDKFSHDERQQRRHNLSRKLESDRTRLIEALKKSRDELSKRLLTETLVKKLDALLRELEAK